MDAVSGQRHAGVLGRPIEHSLSPVLHRAAYAALGLGYTYEAIDCGVDDLPAVLARRADWLGFSATMPLKRALLDVADEVAPVARQVGAANTLLPLDDRPGAWVADNTDVAGIVATLGDLRPRTATVLGAGGTARATLAAVARLGLDTCGVLVRDHARTADLSAAATRCGLDVTVGILVAGSSALDADLVVSTLPPGAADAVAEHAWSAGQTILDVVYAGWPTPLSRAAVARGASVRSGAAMLLHQAAEQVQLMTGRPAPVAAMRAAVLAAVPGSGA